MKIKDVFKKFSSKSNIKLLLILAIIGFIVLTTFTNVGLDPNNFDFYKWFTNTVITIAISIAGMLLGEVVAGDSLKSKENGLYQRTLQKYIELSNKIQSILMYFSDFLIWFKEKETLTKQIKYLISKDIKEDKDIINHIEIEKLEELKKQVNFQEIQSKKTRDEKLKLIKICKNCDNVIRVDAEKCNLCGSTEFISPNDKEIDN